MFKNNGFGKRKSLRQLNKFLMILKTFQTGHVIEIVTKLFLVVQNCTGKPPAVNISTQFNANFGTHSVTLQFKVSIDSFYP